MIYFLHWKKTDNGNSADDRTFNCQLLISVSKYEYMLGKILGVIVANHLKCDKCVSNICSKAYRKLSTLVRVIKLRSFQKRCTVSKAFSQSQFRNNADHLCGCFMEDKQTIK